MSRPVAAESRTAFPAVAGGVLAAGLVLAGCAMPSDGRDAASGAVAFRDNCAICHGPGGTGGTITDAPVLTGLSAANDGVFPAAYVLGVLEGHARREEFSGAMPEFAGAGMGSGPFVDVAGLDRPVSARTAGVLAYLESIQD